jgi:anaerobic ribonucleoside-triphosphate reductase activating protein
VLVHGKLETSTVNGPGNRAVIWFQGCTLGCKGCWNQETHAFEGKYMSVQDVLAWIEALPKDIEGITFSGGEPIQQGSELALLMIHIKHFRPDLSIGMYTGYTLKELEAGQFQMMAYRPTESPTMVQGSAERWNIIKRYLDFAIMGRYNEQQATSEKPMCGSRNQEVVFFSDRYTKDDLEEQAFEMIIGDDGLVSITGFPVGVDLDKDFK